jgi:hypothetical protein
LQVIQKLFDVEIYANLPTEKLLINLVNQLTYISHRDIIMKLAKKLKTLAFERFEAVT